MSDTRFTRLRTDPRFRKPKRNQQRVVVDERFKSILDNDRPHVKKGKNHRVDKYGRHLSISHEREKLNRFYRMNDSSQDVVKPVDYARGEVLLESSSDDDDDDDDTKGKPDSDDDGDGEVVLGQVASMPIPVSDLDIDLNEDDDSYADLDAQAAAYANEHAENDDDDSQQDDAIKTKRIAVVNLDWDHVGAGHLYRIFSSLLPSVTPTSTATLRMKSNEKHKDRTTSASKIGRGKVMSVRVYLSEFGKARLKREEVEGPPKEIFKKTRRDDNDLSLTNLIEEDDGDEYDEDALRKYQLERLRYYYAIVTCDTVEAAAFLISELNGTELERSANVFDLSFVPDDMTFDNEFRDETTLATQSSSSMYKGLDFSTEALRHSKVKLKWDEDDPERNKVTRKALTRKEIEEGDYRAYIASSDSEQSEQECAEGKKDSNEARDKLRHLLLGGNDDNLPEGWDVDPFSNDKDNEQDMEITFMPALSEANAKHNGDETTLEKYKRKQKEKRKQRLKEWKDKSGTQKGPESTKKIEDTDDDFFDAATSDEESEEGAERAGVLALGAESDSASEHSDILKHHGSSSKKPLKKLEKAMTKKRNKNKHGKHAIDSEDEEDRNFQVDVKDERFKALFEDHNFAIDPTNPHFKKTKGTTALLEERTKRQRVLLSDSNLKQSTEDGVGEMGLQRLIESVKRKSAVQVGKGIGKRRKI